MGCIAFSPLCQGILTNKYISEDDAEHQTRAEKLDGRFHWGDAVTRDRLDKVRELNKIAQARGQNMAQMAVAWVLRNPGLTSALIGASRPGQIEDIVAGLSNLEWSDEELTQIETILAG